MWLLKIEGITKDQFHEVCFMSAQCKRVVNVLHAQYHLKKYLVEDLNELKKKYKFTYSIVNLGRTPKSSIWFY